MTKSSRELITITTTTTKIQATISQNFLKILFSSFFLRHPHLSRTQRCRVTTTITETQWVPPAPARFYRRGRSRQKALTICDTGAFGRPERWRGGFWCRRKLALGEGKPPCVEHKRAHMMRTHSDPWCLAQPIVEAGDMEHDLYMTTEKAEHMRSRSTYGARTRVALPNRTTGRSNVLNLVRNDVGSL